jgi:hypothetical protein
VDGVIRKGEPIAMAEIKLPIHVNFPDDWMEQIVNRLRNDPEAEWAEIVRCKDCKWSDISAMGHLAVCNHARGLVSPSPNSYCNFAERRTE